MNALVERQAKDLASDHRESSEVRQVLWFPDEQQVRLVVVTPETPVSDDGEVHAFYFRAVPEDDLPVATGLALVRPDEVGKLRLPRGWGDWPEAVVLE